MFEFLSSLVPCIGTIVFFTLLFGFITLLRWFRHREVMAQIQQGLLPVAHGRRTGDTRTLLAWGLGLTALGLALIIGLYPLGFGPAAPPLPFHFGPWMLLGLIPFFMGLALLIIYYASRRDGSPQKAEEGQPARAPDQTRRT